MKTLFGRPVPRATIAFVLTFATAVAALPAWDLDLAEQAGRLLGIDDWYAVGVVQDGRLHPVRNREIVLRSRPFAVVVVTGDADGLLMNASPVPVLYDGIRAGRPLGEILEEPDMFMGMAEYYFNDERALYVSEVFPHYLFYSSPSEHRYDFVHVAPGAVIGYRTVEYLLDLDSDTGGYPVAEWNGPLYLSFVYSVFEEGVRVELQRDTAKLLFRVDTN